MASDMLSKLRDPSLLISDGLIDGKWRSAPNGATFPVYEPATGTVLKECANLGLQDFKDAIDSAEVGTKQFYESTTAKERGSMLRRWFDLVTANVEDCAQHVYQSSPRARS